MFDEYENDSLPNSSQRRVLVPQIAMAALLARWISCHTISDGTKDVETTLLET